LEHSKSAEAKVSNMHSETRTGFAHIREGQSSIERGIAKVRMTAEYTSRQAEQSLEVSNTTAARVSEIGQDMKRSQQQLVETKNSVEHDISRTKTSLDEVLHQEQMILRFSSSTDTRLSNLETEARETTIAQKEMQRQIGQIISTLPLLHTAEALNKLAQSLNEQNSGLDTTAETEGLPGIGETANRFGTSQQPIAPFSMKSRIRCKKTVYHYWSRLLTVQSETTRTLGENEDGIDHALDRDEKQQVIATEISLRVSFNLPFIRRSVTYTTYASPWDPFCERRLQFRRILDNDSPFFKACTCFDMVKIRQLLDTNAISPFDEMIDGRPAIVCGIMFMAGSLFLKPNLNNSIEMLKIVGLFKTFYASEGISQTQELVYTFLLYYSCWNSHWRHPGPGVMDSITATYRLLIEYSREDPLQDVSDLIDLRNLDNSLVIATQQQDRWPRF
jgi:hypothetical protein